VSTIGVVSDFLPSYYEPHKEQPPLLGTSYSQWYRSMANARPWHGYDGKRGLRRCLPCYAAKSAVAPREAEFRRMAAEYLPLESMWACFGSTGLISTAGRLIHLSNLCLAVVDRAERKRVLRQRYERDITRSLVLLLSPTKEPLRGAYVTTSELSSGRATCSTRRWSRADILRTGSETSELVSGRVGSGPGVGCY
jgi:hypothetical protein